MPSVDDKHIVGEDPNELPLQVHYSPQPSEPFPGMPLHVYPIPNQYLQPQQPVRSKRRQVKNACTHCQKACKKCDDARPCLRCVKYGISEECIDSQRKERKKGIKRGPYKKRDEKYRAGSNVDPRSVPSHTVSAASGGGQPMPYMPMPGYPPGFYGHYPPLASKEGQPVYSTPQYFLAPVPHAVAPLLQGAPEGDPNMYPPQGYYQAAVLTPLPYHQYTIPRADGSTLLNQYPVYPGQVYKGSGSAQGIMIGGDSVRAGEEEEDMGKVV